MIPGFLLLSGCSSTESRIQPVTLDARGFPTGTAYLIDAGDRDFWLVHGIDAFTALSAQAHHPADQGDQCRTRFMGRWDGKQWLSTGSGGFFSTPCIGSGFGIDGKKLFGPDPCALDTYPVDVLDGKIKVHVEQPTVKCAALVGKVGFMCDPKYVDILSEPCPSGAEIGKPYYAGLYTACGIQWMFLDGHWWEAAPVLKKDGGPPDGWYSPVAPGTIILLDREHAQFLSPSGKIVMFVAMPGERRAAEELCPAE